MAHFAELDENDVVVNVLVVNNDVITIDGEESELVGIEFLNSIYGHKRWKKTSYNAAENGYRKHYCGKGFTYNGEWDAFVPPQPYPSWKLDYTTFTWEAPVTKPASQEGFELRWAEHRKEWIQFPVD
jgi:hypothetical protein